MPCSSTVHRQPRSQHWQLIKRFPLPNLIRRALQSSRLRDSRRTSPRLPLCEARPTSRLATGSSRSLTRPQTDAESQQYPRYPAKQSIQPSQYSKQSNQHWQNQWIGSSISVFSRLSIRPAVYLSHVVVFYPAYLLGDTQSSYPNNKSTFQRLLLIYNFTANLLIVPISHLRHNHQRWN